jgi:hypothetical protein
MAEPMLIAKCDRDLHLLPGLVNRHGLIAGATGTGKTVTLQRIAEQLSATGVPVFMADVKGDLSGLSQPGAWNPRLKERAEMLGMADLAFTGFPVTFWDVWGEKGHPVRATISDMGPLLLGRMLNLNDTQQGVLTLCFKIADDQGLLLLDLKDLRALVQYVGTNARQFTVSHGNISAASIGAIQRGLLELEHQGGDRLFGEPALNPDDLMQTGAGGRGVINILAADRLMQMPKIYATFLLWLLSEMFERLPEIGDTDKPRLVFFFDEAHLLFNDAPAALVDKIEQVVRLIRSKGVGVFFVTQNPLDVPDRVLGQLGNRVQHALRAFTPRDQKAVKTAATTLRANPALDTEKAITELAVGEALVSFLDAKGRPEVVERAFVCPPASRIGPASAEEQASVISASAVAGIYEQAIDRESAYEMLRDRAASGTTDTGAATGTQPPAEDDGLMSGLKDILFGTTGPRGGRREGVIDAAARSAARSIGSGVGREIVRGLLGSLLGGGRRRR